MEKSLKSVTFHSGGNFLYLVRYRSHSPTSSSENRSKISIVLHLIFSPIGYQSTQQAILKAYKGSRHDKLTREDDVRETLSQRTSQGRAYQASAPTQNTIHHPQPTAKLRRNFATSASLSNDRPLLPLQSDALQPLIRYQVVPSEWAFGPRNNPF